MNITKFWSKFIRKHVLNFYLYKTFLFFKCFNKFKKLKFQHNGFSGISIYDFIRMVISNLHIYCGWKCYLELWSLGFLIKFLVFAVLEELCRGSGQKNRSTFQYFTSFVPRHRSISLTTRSSVFFLQIGLLEKLYNKWIWKAFIFSGVSGAPHMHKRDIKICKNSGVKQKWFCVI